MHCHNANVEKHYIIIIFIQEKDVKSTGAVCEQTAVTTETVTSASSEPLLESEMSALEESAPSSSKKDENDSGLSVEEGSAAGLVLENIPNELST